MNMITPNLFAPAIRTGVTAGPIVIAAGGTGGHFFPAEALAGILLARGRDIVLVTDRRSGGAASAVFAGHPMHVLRGAGIAGRGIMSAARGGLALCAGTMQARALLGQIRPSAVVGFGGYPTVAPVLGSRWLRHRPPIILHEQNAVLGRAHRALARYATVLALSFAQTALVPAGVRTMLTGNPVRRAVAACAGAAYQPPGEGPIRLLVLGGSQGARVLSEVVPSALAALPEGLRRRVVVTQQCRAEDLDGVRADHERAGIQATLASFFDDIATLIAGAHVVIARAGASTVAELAVIGRPAILVPLPGAIDDHQAANAMALGEGAWLMRQDVFSAGCLRDLLERLVTDQPLLAQAAMLVASHGRVHAAEALADLVESVADGAAAMSWLPANTVQPPVAQP